MYNESRKIHLIEELLKVENDETLTALETVLREDKKVTKKMNIYDFLGTITKKDADKMTKIIAETSEVIHPDDWK